MNHWQPFQQAVTRLGSQEYGAALIYFALMLPILIAMGGLALDGSNLYLQQRHVQTAADSAALAGARLVAIGQTTTQINAEVQTLATTNGAQSYTWSYIQSNTGVQVNTSKTFPTYFAGFFGYQTLSVQATAGARYYSITGKSDLLPMTIQCPVVGFVFDTPYVLLDDAANAPGSIGWLDWNGGASSSGELASNFTTPSNSGTWNVGDLVPAYPGTKSASAIWDAIDTWVGKPISIPLWDVVTGTGSNTTYRICGFAEFQVASASKATKMIIGTFIRTLKRATAVGSGANYGVRDIRFAN